jgi:hypothetical protein
MPDWRGNDDATIVYPRNRVQQPARKSRRGLLLGLGAGALALGGAAAGGAWWALRKPVFQLDTLSEAQIDAASPCTPALSYFNADRNVVVIDFPSLLDQGLTLDRVAAFVEKASQPHTRVLTDSQLAAAISSTGDTVQSYYYGHDYQAADLARFFILADAEGITLTKQELWLKAVLTQLGWFNPGAVGAIITVPAAGGDVTPDMRSVILHHEISHGAFYTVPEYRHYTESFWYSLTDGDRAAFTGFLGRQGYDTSLTELMLNETQAYLVFTPDKRFFNANAVGKTDAEVDQLRQGFVANMPNFWLRPYATEALPRSSGTPICPVGADKLAALLPRHGCACLCFGGGGFTCT